MNTTETSAITYAIDIMERQIKELKAGAAVGDYELAMKIGYLRTAINGLKKLLE